ncbi:hypothetical protein [Lactobacillus kitasatonis]|uniref:hypothetical protein n=1 Tax=Lactobacillus kitasatonis TaxID=237446 RepID=UPI000AD48AA6|nr:hypothetical protein [Lactobacillus kitasatonis]
MTEFSIKGQRLRPGLTITEGWYTFVITNEGNIKRISSGNHAELKLCGREFNDFLVSYHKYNAPEHIRKLSSAINKKE